MLGGKKIIVLLPAFQAGKTLQMTCDAIPLRANLSEYHTGYRAFSREVLEHLPLKANSDDFVFDNEMLVQCLALGFRCGEISCPARYFPDASSL